MKEKHQEKEECINLEKGESVYENCEKEVKNNQDCLQCDLCAPSKIVFQEQSYSNLHSAV